MRYKQAFAAKPRIFVVGCASLDTIHIEHGTDKTIFNTMGGAGLYTALAARAAGADVTLFSPRTDDLPDKFRRVPQLIDWTGPLVSAEEMPALEIIHHGSGRATLLDARWGAEDRLVPNALPESLADYSVAHIAALSSAARQSSFADACRARGVPKISAGTYARLVYGDPHGVKTLLAQCDFFFMNANESRGLFQSVESTPFFENTVVFVTDGERGAYIFEHEPFRHVVATQVQEVDPTGAGDTFCGVTLAGIFGGNSIDEATAHAAELAARCITMPGPEAMLAEV